MIKQNNKNWHSDLLTIAQFYSISEKQTLRTSKIEGLAYKHWQSLKFSSVAKPSLS